ncbi:MAG: right-handed parallel beta-helix repeat-containing protein, partial [Planctomycetota bacterium]
GISVDTGSDAVTITNNIVYNFSTSQIRLDDFTTNTVGVYHNTFYVSTGTQTLVDDNQGDGGDFRNNIFYHNGTGGYCLRADHDLAAATRDCNLYYRPNGAKLAIDIDNVEEFSTLAVWRAETDDGDNSIEADPQFSTDPPSAAAHFELQTRDATTPDIGADEYTGAAPPAATITNTTPTIYYDKGGTLTITGTNLETTYEAWIEGVRGTVDSAAATTVVATFPAANFNGSTLTLKVGGGREPNYEAGVTARNTIPVDDDGVEYGGTDHHTTIASALSGLLAWKGSDAFTAGITIEVYTGSYAESIVPDGTLNPQTSPNDLTIMEKSGQTADLDVTGETYGVDFNGIDNVTVDGFTITASNQTVVYVQLATGANNVVRNCNITLTASSGTEQVFYVRDGATIEGNTITVNANNGSSGTEAVYVLKDAADDDPVRIQDNTITFTVGAGSAAGHDVIAGDYLNSSYLEIRRNTITLDTSAGGTGCKAVEIDDDNCVIDRNVIKGVGNESIYGIDLDLNNSTVTNNIVYGFATCQLLIVGDSGHNVYHNTFYYTGSATVTLVNDDGAFANLENNIFYHAGDNGFCAELESGSAKTINNNLFYHPNAAQAVTDDGVTYATLADWRGATSHDYDSMEANPDFVTDPPTTAADFELQNVSPCISEANAATGQTEDYEGEARDASPDIGADEFIGAPPAPPSITNVTPDPVIADFGRELTITGSGFLDTYEVTVGGVVGAFVVDNDNQVRATFDGFPSGGLVTVRIGGGVSDSYSITVNTRDVIPVDDDGGANIHTTITS